MTKTVANVLALRPEQGQFSFITEAVASELNDQGVILVRVAEDLEALSGPQAVAFFNAAKSEHAAPVKRFADKKAAASRLWAVFQDLAIKAQFAADEAAATGQPAPAPIPPAVQKKLDEAHARSNKLIGDAIANNPELAKLASAPAEKARDRAKPANAKDHPAPKPAAKRPTGINLPPMKVAYPCREGSKQAILVDMLSRVQGATMDELLKALSGGEKPWLEISVKSGMNWDMNKIKGYGIRTTKRAEFDCYHLVLPKGMDAPHPHQPLKKSALKSTPVVTVTEAKKEG